MAFSFRTKEGPVPVPKQRARSQLNVRGLGQAKAEKGWLQGKDDNQYARAIKQGMLVASFQMKLNDAQDPQSPVAKAAEAAGPDRRQRVIQENQRVVQDMKEGLREVNVDHHKRQVLKAQLKSNEMERFLLVKFSQKIGCGCARRERYFSIDNGELKVYRSQNKNAKLTKDSFNMRDVVQQEVFVEEKQRGTYTGFKWDEGYTHRLSVQSQRRRAEGKSPLFLYPRKTADGKKDIENWKRAFKLALVLASDSDRRVMRMVIGRSASGAILKGWEALFWYYHEWLKTKQFLRKLLMRLEQVDKSKGWVKLRLVHQREDARATRKREQMLFAIRFMSQKMGKSGELSNQSYGEVRDRVVTRIQQQFRIYREEKIFDRSYPIGSGDVSRMQRARQGLLAAVRYDAVRVGEAIQMNINDQEIIAQWRESPQIFEPAKGTYSEDTEPNCLMDVRVSENFQMLSLTTRVREGGLDELEGGSWSKYVHLDRISSVILHTPPVLGVQASVTYGEGGPRDAGVWCTVNGPRIGWGKRILPGDGRREPQKVGVADAFGVAKGLRDGRSGKVRYVSLSAEVVSNTVTMPQKRHLLGRSQEQDVKEDIGYTVLVLYLLGYSFMSEVAHGESPNYRFPRPLEAYVPVSTEKGAMAALDDSEVSCEIYQVSLDEKRRMTKRSLILVAGGRLTKFFEVSSFHDQSMRAEVSAHMSLVVPEAPKEDKQHIVGKVSVKLRSEVLEQAPNKGCLSPELVGGGLRTGFYTSHRAAWFDPELGAEHFRLDHTSNFLELELGQLRLPEDEEKKRKGGGAPDVFHVRATVGGLSVVSNPVHRPREEWQPIVGLMADPTVLFLRGTRLCVPLPPGCWGGNDEGGTTERGKPERGRLEVLIEIIPGEPHGQDADRGVDYDSFIRGASSERARRPSAAVRAERDGYKCTLVLKGLMVDRKRTLSAFLSKDRRAEVTVDVLTNVPTGTTDESAVLSLDATLRDRDYVQGTLGGPGESRCLCIGDKVMMLVEEALMYPLSDVEFRERMCPGQFDPEKAGGPWPGDGCPLRDPATSSEYVESGLGGLPGRLRIMQSHIPNRCKDMIPFKFVMPTTEMQFQHERRPGIFWRILDDLATKERGRGGRTSQTRPPPKVVTHMSHLVKQVPATLLAMYNDGTCDVEVSSEFIQFWAKRKERRFLMPGWRLVVGDRTPRGGDRTILEGVPSMALHGVHADSFHVYDAAFSTSEDVAMSPAPAGDCNPREYKPHIHDKRNLMKSNFRLASGPLPGDASPSSCLYEWSLRVRAQNEFEMYQLVAMLKQCKRQNQLQQLLRLQDLHNTVGSQLPDDIGQRSFTPGAGQVEVVLVEARRLRPPDFEKTVKYQESQYIHGASKGVLMEDSLRSLAGTAASGAASRSTPLGHKLNTFVEFRMFSNDQAVSFKGSKVQSSSWVEDTESPNWSELPGLQNSGGWRFKTGLVDPEKHEDLILDFEVKWKSFGVPGSIGKVQIPVFAEGNYLSNEGEPFRNLWLPLMRKQDGEAVMNPPVGEIHIMTRWTPASQLHLPPGHQQITVKAQLLKELWPKFNLQRLREPLYDFEAQYLHYNANLIRDPNQTPETPAEHHKRHVQELFNAVPYINCLEQRQENAWLTFGDALQAAGMDPHQVSIRELRQRWTQEENAQWLTQLQELIRNGVPGSHRAHLWMDLTGANRVVEAHLSDGVAEDTVYQRYLDLGQQLRLDALQQLNEDVFSLGNWESSVPPIPAAVDQLLLRLKQAQEVCRALVAYEESGVVYCQSLLILAFFLLMPTGEKIPRFHIDYSDRWVEELQARLSGVDTKNIQISDKHGKPVSAGFLRTLALQTSGGVSSYTLGPSGPLAQDESGMRRGSHTSITSGSSTLQSRSAPEPDRFPLYFQDPAPVQLPESTVFWLLHTLIGNPSNAAYRAYYGAPPHAHVNVQLLSGHGAMEDVNKLEAHLYIKDPDLWHRFNSLGFQLATVFYGVFMRLFATYMPTSTVFRFWDLLFSTSSDPAAAGKARDPLIYLAFGIMYVSRTRLLKCQAAREVSTTILGNLGSLYDTTTVIELVESSQRFLTRSSYHLNLVDQAMQDRDDAFHHTNQMLTEQHEVLTNLVHDREGLQIAATGYNSPFDQQGVMTDEVVSQVLPALKQGLEAASLPGGDMAAITDGGAAGAAPKYEPELEYRWGMFRRMPLAANMLCASLVEKLKTQIGKTFKGRLEQLPMVVGPDDASIDAFGDALELPPERLPGIEPKNDPSSRIVIQNVIPTWGGDLDALWRAFTNRRDVYTMRNFALRDTGSLASAFSKLLAPKTVQYGPSKARECISLNDICAGMVCLSRGTLGEKAVALFNIYAFTSHVPKQLFHHTPPTRYAMGIAKGNRTTTAAELGQTLTPPTEEVERKHVLRFKVWSKHTGNKKQLGDVYVPDIGPFVSYSTDDTQFRAFNIWGIPEAPQSGAQAGAVQGKDGRVNLGELRMSIVWRPASSGEKNTGQLCIRLKSVLLYRWYCSDVTRMNPSVEVTTLMNGREEKIKRWDPRGLFARDQNVGILTAGAFGGEIDFFETMAKSAVGDRLVGLRGRNMQGMGWKPETEEWEWNETWGRQLSEANYQNSMFKITAASKNNVMSLIHARMLCQTILQRSMMNFSNRQAALIADSVFSRDGAVAGIIEALLVTSPHADVEKYKDLGLEEIKKKLKAEGRSFTDVTKELALDHERQISENGGWVNMFKPHHMLKLKEQKTPMSVTTMGIPNSGRGQRLLWVRYVRGGDGERCTQAVPVSSDGLIVVDDKGFGAELRLESSEPVPPPPVAHRKKPKDEVVAPTQLITKDEFVMCMVKHPILGEGLRRMGSAQRQEQPRKVINLQVTIMDPYQRESNMLLNEVQQSILLEVWDSDIASSDFLGEAFLPGLHTLGPVKRSHVLPLKPPDDDPDAENGPTRPDPGKSKFMRNAPRDPNDPKTANLNITGELFVQASWEFPAYKKSADGSTAEPALDAAKYAHPNKKDPKGDRAVMVERLNTGILTLVIERASNLRRSDAAKGRDCDPRVFVYVRNDVFDRWKTRSVHKTKTVQNNRFPVWNDPEQHMELLTGEFEAKLPFKDNTWTQALADATQTKRTRRRRREERDASAVGSSAAGVRVNFGSRMGRDGENHDVRVYLNDTVRDFKAKVQLACKKEADYARRSQAPGVTPYASLQLGYNHIVTVFVPPEKVRRLHELRRGEDRELQRQYDLALQDPSNWQPLDSVHTFEQVERQGFASFTRQTPQLIRIYERSEAFKAANLRYKEWDEANAWGHVADMDLETQCFGFAKYEHTSDGGSTEWRPAIIRKDVDNPQEHHEAIPNTYKVDWATDAGGTPTDMDRLNVILAPKTPKMDMFIHRQHEQVLKQARTLRQSGKSDWEIEAILNKILEDQFREHQGTPQAADYPKPPPLTVEIIRHYLQHHH